MSCTSWLSGTRTRRCRAAPGAVRSGTPSGSRCAGRVRRSQFASWSPPTDRPDVVRQVADANEGRVPELVPVRIGRMIATPFAFLRGAAAVMAVDFASLPATGITPVICGDAHLGNFGFYASPERNLVFDLNDFDEAHPGPWEWDLRRLVTSVWVAGRQNGCSEVALADAVRGCVAAYRAQCATWPGCRCWHGRSSGWTSTGSASRRTTAGSARRSGTRPDGPGGAPATGRCPADRAARRGAAHCRGPAPRHPHRRP